MKAYAGIGLSFYLLTSVSDEGEKPTSRPGRFTRISELPQG
jgi:hypothetical protein